MTLAACGVTITTSSTRYVSDVLLQTTTPVRAQELTGVDPTFLPTAPILQIASIVSVGGGIDIDMNINPMISWGPGWY
jgi:hypothetical protein